MKLCKQIFLFLLSAVLLVETGCSIKTSGKDGDFFTGGTVGDYVARGIVSSGTWEDGAKNLMKNLKDNGMDWVRVTVTTNSIDAMDENTWDRWKSTISWTDEVWCCKQYAGYILEDAQKAGLNKILCMFLGQGGDSYSGRQPCPLIWADPNGGVVSDRKDTKPLAPEQAYPLIKDYAKGVAKYYKEKGIKIELYEIGNEIEYGIAGYFINNINWRPPTINGEHYTSLSYLKREIWPVEAQVIKAAMEGIREVDNKAKFTLHTASLSNVEVVQGFFDYMTKEAKIDFDVIGLSYYWNEANVNDVPYFKNPQLLETTNYLKALDKSVIFTEFAYPCNDRATIDQLRGEAHIGYPYTAQGQYDFAKDFLDWAKNTAKVDGAIWFYPDYFPDATQAEWGRLLEDCGLFLDAQTPNSTLSVFKLY